MNIKRMIDKLTNNISTKTEFIKESNSLETQLETLKEYRKKLNKEGQEIIDKDIKVLEAGIKGEKNVEFELKNSNIPMYVLHDLYLEHDGLTAQIDYMIITAKKVYLIESKNLWGNIRVTSDLTFLRQLYINGEKTEIAMYSPIEQSKRHIRLIMQIKEKFDRSIRTRYKKETVLDRFDYFVVMANPETYFNTTFTAQFVKQKVVRGDRLVNFIMCDYNRSNLPEWSKSRMLEEANYFLGLHKENPNNYTKKYDKYVIDVDEQINEQLTKSLKYYRYNTAADYNIKPYEIFKNDAMEEMVHLRPQTIEDLSKIRGFDNNRISSYGNEILSIIKKVMEEYNYA